MSSKRFATPLFLDIRRSRLLIAWIVAVHLLGVSVAVLVPLEWFWRAGIILAVAVSLLFSWKKFVFGQSRLSVRRLVWDAEGDWYVVFPDGKEEDARLLPDSFVHPWLVILNLRMRQSGRVISVPFFRDSLDKDTLRKVRVRLRTLPPDYYVERDD
jgi:toxin CptA